MWNEILEQPSILQLCQKNNSKTIKDIVENINKKDIHSVYIAARGTSDHAAVYAKYVIEILTGVPVALAAPSVLTMYQKQICFDGCLVIGISQSGMAEDVLEVVRAANKQNAITVSITNSEKSPLAAEAMFHLYCSAGLEKSVAATKTFTSQLMIMAELAAEWAQDYELKSELLKLPQSIPDIFKMSDLIENSVQRFRFMNECFVLARGINYAIALETALKIQETTYVHAKAFATSDFYHGPFAMVEKDMPVIVYAPEGPSFADVSNMVDKLIENRTELVVISNNEEILSKGNCSFMIPKTNNDILSPFYNVVIAQMFACKLSQIKGLNPDKPRGLNKVTITR